MLNYQRVNATKSFWWISWDEVLRSMILQKIASVWASEVTSWEQLLRHRTLVAVRLRHPVVKLGQLAPGQADMAVSSSVGSNIFDILVTWRSLNAGDMWWKFGARRKFMGQFPPERPTYIFIYIYIHTVYIHIYIYIYLMVKTVKTMVSGEDFWKTNPLINAKKNRDVVFRTRGGPTSSVVDQACNRVE